MTDLAKTLRPWIVFAGCVLVVAVLYWTRAVLVPIALATLLTFLLAPPVMWLQRWVGRVAAIAIVVGLVFAGLALAGWGIGLQLAGLAEDLPRYRGNIRQKIADVRGASRGSSVEKVQQTLEEIQNEIEKPAAPRGSVRRPLVVRQEESEGLWRLPAWFAPLMEPLATAGLVLVLLLFMLVEREDLRGRLIGMVGHGHLAITTKAFDEAARRVSRYLLMQSLINLTFGVGVAVGLWWIGVPYPLLWASLAALLRFIPYVGPWIGAGAPILVSLAALPGWTQSVYVFGLFLGLELFTNMVLETFLYAGAAGVSQVALLVAVAFWTWLWGPIGLLMATPLTVCLVVIGKHVPGLEFVSTLMADAPALAPDASYYQRLLARDQSEAAELIERFAATQGADAVYDSLLIPALNYAERDRSEGRLSPEDEASIAEATRELMADAAALRRSAARAAGDDAAEQQAAPAGRVTVLGYPANSQSDELALEMLSELLRGTPVDLEVGSVRMLASEIVARVQNDNRRIICIADLPPSAPSKTRYVVKKLRSALPALTIVVARLAPAALADESAQPLLDAGATHVTSSLLETARFLAQSPVRPPADVDAPRAHVA